MKWYIKILRWIWEFPQCLLGLILTLFYNVKYKETFREISIYAGKFPSGISLGLFIIININRYKYNRNYIKEHEWGHTRWSLYLGPLYLLIICLPSIIWAWIHTPKSKKSYYWFYTERWADKSGGVPKRY